MRRFSPPTLIPPLSLTSKRIWSVIVKNVCLLRTFMLSGRPTLSCTLKPSQGFAFMSHPPTVPSFWIRRLMNIHILVRPLRVSSTVKRWHHRHSHTLSIFFGGGSALFLAGCVVSCYQLTSLQRMGLLFCCAAQLNDQCNLLWRLPLSALFLS